MWWMLCLFCCFDDENRYVQPLIASLGINKSLLNSVMHLKSSERCGFMSFTVERCFVLLWLFVIEIASGQIMFFLLLLTSMKFIHLVFSDFLFQLARYSTEGLLQLGPLGSTTFLPDTKCLIDDGRGRIPSLKKCDAVSRSSQKLWDFTQVQRITYSKPVFNVLLMCCTVRSIGGFNVKGVWYGKNITLNVSLICDMYHNI